MKKLLPYWPLIILLAIIKFILPFILPAAIYELHRDEYLYYEQGQHLALGYLENPPLISYMAMISSWFGGSEFVIKCWPALAGAATLILTCMLTAELGGNRFAQFLAGLGIMSGAYMRIHYLFQPNFLDIFFWTLAIYFLVRFINSGRSYLIYCMVFSLAFGWWSKYSILFMIIALLGGLLLTQHRKIFTKKHTWMAAGAGILLVVPNLVWQYLHNWPLIHHMNELRETQLGYISPFDFLKEQLLMLISFSPVWIIGLFWLLKNNKYRIVGYIYLLIILLLMFGSGKGYYALGAYPMLIAAGAVAWQNLSLKKIWIRPTLATLILVTMVLIVPALLPIWEPQQLAAFNKKNKVENKWEDQQLHPISQDFGDMLGWKELAVKSETYFQSLPDSIKTRTIIFCGNYGQAGSLKFYGRDKNFRDRVVSANGSFLLWMPSPFYFDHFMFVGEEKPSGERAVLFEHFEEVILVDSVTYPLSRQFGNKIFMYRNADSLAVRMANEGISALKKKFTR
jgi:4-amino-4-deoxy-L-arabinose transferase-like glycosyltransferase